MNLLNLQMIHWMSTGLRTNSQKGHYEEKIWYVIENDAVFLYCTDLGDSVHVRLLFTDRCGCVQLYKV